MKRVLAILFTLLMALTSCANPYEEEIIYEKEYETEADVSDYAAYTSGDSIILDRKTVRMKPLLGYEEYCEADDIEFDPDTPSDGYYIDYDTLGSAKFEFADGGTANIARPNANYLTDGYSRMKLCPDEICRNDPEQNCTHISLVGGYVWGNYVYYIGKYRAEEQKVGQWCVEYENYLMRYCISENEVELVARLPWYCYIVQAAYGVLYIAYVDSVPFTMKAYHPNTLIYDCDNVRLALIEGFNGLFLSEGYFGKAVCGNEAFYYIEGNSVWRCEYDLSSQTVIGKIKADWPKLLGYVKNRVIYSAYDYQNSVTSVYALKDDGQLRTVIENCTDAALINDGLSAYLYVIEGDEIARYKLDRVARAEERTVVFTESDELDFNEHLQSIETIRGTISFTTTVGQYTDHTRTYLLTERGAVFHGEKGAPETEESAEEETDTVP